MDPFTNTVFLFIFAIFGFIISKFWGIKLNRIFSDLGAMAAVATFLFFMLEVNATISNFTNPLLTFFVENLPGMLLGDVLGSVAGTVLKE